MILLVYFFITKKIIDENEKYIVLLKENKIIKKFKFIATINHA